jgi:hypothetical protein
MTSVRDIQVFIKMIKDGSGDRNGNEILLFTCYKTLHYKMETPSITITPQQSKDVSSSYVVPDVVSPPNRSYHSYHHDPPAVHVFDDPAPRKHAYYGNANLQPNTGLTNSYEYALFGLALHELLDRLRLSVIINALLVMALLFFTWWQRLFQPVHLVMSFLLAALVLTLLVVEIKSIWDGTGSNSAATPGWNAVSSSNREMLVRILKRMEQTGLMILYHPIGRIMYLMTCGGLCFWIGGAVEALLGGMFMVNAGGLLYCWITYPEFRRTFAPPEDAAGQRPAATGDEAAGTSFAARVTSWSYYSNAGERASLLSSPPAK